MFLLLFVFNSWAGVWTLWTLSKWFVAFGSCKTRALKPIFFLTVSLPSLPLSLFLCVVLASAHRFIDIEKFCAFIGQLAFCFLFLPGWLARTLVSCHCCGHFMGISICGETKIVFGARHIWAGINRNRNSLNCLAIANYFIACKIVFVDCVWKIYDFRNIMARTRQSDRQRQLESGCASRIGDGTTF